MEQYGNPANTLADPRGSDFEHKRRPMAAIRQHCLECCGGSSKEVERCTAPGCNLYPYRFGKDPNRAPASEKQREAARRNIRKALNQRSRGQISLSDET